MHRTADMGYRRNVIMHRTADIGYRRNDITHRLEDIGERRYDIICRMRPMMHRRNDIMHRTADIGYRTNHIIHQMNDIGIRRQVIKKVGIFILLTPHPHKDISGMVTKQLAMKQAMKLSIRRKEQNQRTKKDRLR